MSKKIISIMLAIILSLSMLSLAFAEDVSPGEPAGEPTSEIVTEPTGETPSEPASEPTGEDPTEPASEPTGETPSEPESEPTGENPSEPASEPTGDNPSEPVSEPTGENPSEPVSEPTTEHVHAYTLIIKPATKSADGSVTQYCAGCGEETVSPVAKIASIALSNKNCVYSGNVKHPKAIITDAEGNALKKGTDFEIVYNGACQDVGKYSAKITFIGKYKGSATRYFNILPKASLVKTVKESADQIVVTVKQRPAQTSGYQIKVASKKDFSDGVNAYIKDPLAVQKTIRGLAGGTTYYVKVRTYTKVTVGAQEQKLYSAWSDVVECATK